MLTPPTLPESEAPPPPIDERVRENALKKMVALARGNGIKVDKIKIAHAAALTYSFKAQGFVRLTTHYTSKTEPGKSEKGEKIGTPDAFEAALRNMTMDAQKDNAKRQVVLDAVQKRADSGFGAKEDILKFDTLTRDFVSHEGCGTCATTGKTTCPRCGGNKMMTCQNCHGRQVILCPNCRGTGKVNRNGSQSVCTRCKGRTRIQCPHCQGRGSTPCKGCNASGQAACGACKATGWLSHFAHVELIGHLHFNYERQGLPRELSKLIDAFGSRYAEKKDLEATVLTNAYQEDEPRETVPIGYEVTAPYGEITFTLGKKPVEATLLGWNGDLIKAPDFIDDLTKKGQEDLRRAADGQGNVGEHLRNAAKYRILRETIIICAGKIQTRKALSQIMARYKVGISSEKIVQLMAQANRALHIITRKPRIVGLSAGALLFAGISAAYFMAGRGIVFDAFRMNVAAVDPLLLISMIDVCLVLIGIMMGVSSSQIFAKLALKKTLQGLASPAGIKRIMPKIGWTLWAATAISLTLTGVFYTLFVL